MTAGSIDLFVQKLICLVGLFFTEYLAGLLFAALQVTIFTAACFLVIGPRGPVWEPGLFLAVPIVVCFFSYLFSVCVFGRRHAIDHCGLAADASVLVQYMDGRNGREKPVDGQDHAEGRRELCVGSPGGKQSARGNRMQPLLVPSHRKRPISLRRQRRVPRINPANRPRSTLHTTSSTASRPCCRKRPTRSSCSTIPDESRQTPAVRRTSRKTHDGGAARTSSISSAAVPSRGLSARRWASRPSSFASPPSSSAGGIIETRRLIGQCRERE